MNTLYEQQYFALIDINNCYVSCERLFDPTLIGKAVVVLSNNDGCVVSRSNEAKALNIGMAVPWHEVQAVQRAGVQVRSSNYALYGDMSQRFFQVLEQHFDPADLEPYSIDECFIALTAYVPCFDVEQYCRELIQTIERWLGLPCCIGIGYSKTQAKLANHFAKKRTGFQSVCNLTELDLCSYEALLMETDVAEIWGIGAKTSKQLASYGIQNCYDLTFANEHHLIKPFSVLMARCIRELKGQSCISLQDPDMPSQRILSSRSFASPLLDLHLIKQALVFHLNRAHQRLSKQQQLCAVVHVSLYEKLAYAPYKKAISQALGLEYATDDILVLTATAMSQVNVLFKENIKYVKVAIMFSALHPKAQHIDDLWQPVELIQQRETLMQSMAEMKQRFGPDCIQVGYYSDSSAWKMRQKFRSPRYTTCTHELLVIDDSHMQIKNENE
ncbi:DNA polymerase V [Acinetobacter calcoaceticus]|uniref:DNA polymerase V n=1 Tax=Acinetobacter calcoaceticus TaxID=471 RepID=A0A4R1Y317_ACICA|nr:DNA polymerase V [Acinetobacter calcoaceticus]